jgi:hypothetical protein
MQTKFVLGPTYKINCCNTNALGVECIDSENSFGSYDLYGSSEIYQTIILIISNLVLIAPAFKAFFIGNYSRTFINLNAMLISSLYHLCKTNTDHPKGICLIQFCVLKNLDYSASMTLLISVIFFILPFVNEEKLQKDINESKFKNKLPGKKISIKLNFIEDYLLLCYFGFIYITLSSTVFCSNNYIMPLFIGLIISSIIITIIGNIIVTKCLEINKNYFNRQITFIGFFLVSISLALFIVGDYLPTSSYWVTHSLWHIFGALSQLVLLNIRNRSNTLKLL